MVAESTSMYIGSFAPWDGVVLRIGSERRKGETNSETDREPDQPHEHPGGG